MKTCVHVHFLPIFGCYGVPRQHKTIKTWDNNSSSSNRSSSSDGNDGNKTRIISTFIVKRCVRVFVLFFGMNESKNERLTKCNEQIFTSFFFVKIASTAPNSISAAKITTNTITKKIYLMWARNEKSEMKFMERKGDRKLKTTTTKTICMSRKKKKEKESRRNFSLRKQRYFL